MDAIWTGSHFFFYFRHLRHFLVQSKVADFITTLRLVKMEPGIVNWLGAETEGGDLGPLTFTGKRYAAQIHGAFFLWGVCLRVVVPWLTAR